MARELEARHGLQVDRSAADSADPAAAAAIAAGALDALGGIDILVLNAGGPPPVDPTATEPDGWRGPSSSWWSADRPRDAPPAARCASGGWGRIVAIRLLAVRQPIDDLPYSNAGRSALWPGSRRPPGPSPRTG